MKLLSNISGFSVILSGLAKVNKYKTLIEQKRAAGDVEEERKTILEACQIFSRSVTDGLDVRCNVIHPENIPEKGPVVYISNHQSYADILAFLYAIRSHQVSFIAKDSLSRIPVIGPWIRRIRGIYIHRGDARSSLATINEGVSYLKEGFSLVIFPEGTRSQSSDMADFKPGSFKLATKAKVPVVPVSLNGGYHLFEEKGVITKGVTIDFMVHPPIETASMDRHQLAELPKQVEEIVRDGLQQLFQADLEKQNK